MSLPLILGALWVLAATVTALLPMRRQYIPGVTLLILAPGLIGWIGWQHGVVWLLLALFALLSMFRHPLLYFARKALGLPVSLPPDLDKDRA